MIKSLIKGIYNFHASIKDSCIEVELMYISTTAKIDTSFILCTIVIMNIE